MSHPRNSNVVGTVSMNFTADDIIAVMTKHNFDRHGLNSSKYRAVDVDAVNSSAKLIAMLPTVKAGGRFSSGLKGDIQRQIRGYVANGDAIAAAYLLGIRVSPHPSRLLDADIGVINDPRHIARIWKNGAAEIAPPNRKRLMRNVAIATINAALQQGIIPPDYRTPMLSTPVDFEFQLSGYRAEARLQAVMGGKDLSVDVAINRGRLTTQTKEIGADLLATVWMEREHGPYVGRHFMIKTRSGFGHEIAALNLEPTGYKVK